MTNKKYNDIIILQKKERKEDIIMALRSNSFRIVNSKTGKKEIVLYEDVAPNQMEVALITSYLSQGYQPKYENRQKKSEKNPSVKDMMKEMEGTTYLDEFNKLYKEKDGYFNALNVYSKFKKENKK